MDYTLEVRGVSLRFGGVRALTDVSFGVKDGELFSIIGPNGAGKTSIVNCISGRYQPTEGALLYRGRDITALNPNARASLGIGRTFQNLALFHHMSVLDNIMVGRHHLLKNNFITGSLYWLTGARREELEHRRTVEEIIDFLDLQSVRKATAGTILYRPLGVNHATNYVLPRLAHRMPSRTVWRQTSPVGRAGFNRVKPSFEMSCG